MKAPEGREGLGWQLYVRPERGPRGRGTLCVSIRLPFCLRERPPRRIRVSLKRIAGELQVSDAEWLAEQTARDFLRRRLFPPKPPAEQLEML